MADDFTVPAKAKLPFPEAQVTQQPVAQPEAVGNPMTSPTVSLESEARAQGVDDSAIDEAKKVSFSQDELDKFWDATLNNEPYVEQGTIGTKRKIQFSFKTRGTSEVNEINELMESKNVTVRVRWETLQAQLLLAASLHAYNGKTLPKDGDADKSALEKKHEFVCKMPAHVTSGLLGKLIKFDTKVRQMQDEVFSENF